MELGSYSEDQLDQLIVRAESEVGAWRVVEMAAIAEKRRRRSHLADGYRSIVDWTAARADVSHETARRLCWTATRLREAPGVAEQLAAGDISFDRAQLLARLPAEDRDGHQGYDIFGLRRLVANHRRLTRKRERKTGNGYLHLTSGSDDLMVPIWGAFPGLDARMVEKALDQRADEIIPSNQRLAVAERRALAFVAICQDDLYQTGSAETALTDVAVIVDADTAAESGGETGVSVLAGPRLGPGVLEEIICNGNVDLIGFTEKGKPLDLGRRSRTVGRKLRRHVVHRDGGCTVDGCPFSYRLQVHHVIPWSHGGKTDADNLITLCWFHHHVSVHREGLQIIRLGVSRVRLKRPR
ncbi:MAG: endonuclease [Acidimicrobiia bacterium]|nr:endonuclease [Acidimicrobiia bacterium]